MEIYSRVKPHLFHVPRTPKFHSQTIIKMNLGSNMARRSNRVTMSARRAVNKQFNGVNLLRAYGHAVGKGSEQKICSKVEQVQRIQIQAS